MSFSIVHGAGEVRGLKSTSTIGAWLRHVVAACWSCNALLTLHRSRSDRPTVDVDFSPRTVRPVSESPQSTTQKIDGHPHCPHPQRARCIARLPHCLYECHSSHPGISLPVSAPTRGSGEAERPRRSWKRGLGDAVFPVVASQASE